MTLFPWKWKEILLVRPSCKIFLSFCHGLPKRIQIASMGTTSHCWIKCVQALKNPNPLSLMEGWMCLLLLRCFRIGSWVDYLCKSTLDWIQSLSILKPFEKKVFSKLSEKQPVVLSKQPIVLLLGVLRKVENSFLMVDLLSNQNNRSIRTFNRLFVFKP